jgi:hypothetical protein
VAERVHADLAYAVLIADVGKERTRLRGSIGLPVRVVKMRPVSAQALPRFAVGLLLCLPGSQGDAG